MDKLNKLLLPATIIIASLILGGFYYASQVNKQYSIERQQEIKIEENEKQEQEAEQALSACINNAQKTEYDYKQGLLELAREEENPYKYDFPGMFDDAKRQLEQDKAECFKRYPPK